MLTTEFLQDFKRATESAWRVQELRHDISGYQIQRGTRWNPGLSEHEVLDYERAVGFEFAPEVKLFLRVMNGTDLPTLNLYAECGEPYRTGVGVYSFPRDLAIVHARINDVGDNRSAIVTELAEQGFQLADDIGLLPIYAHRYVVCAVDRGTSPVLSIVVREVDAIVYADSLQEYLQKEFLRAGSGTRG